MKGTLRITTDYGTVEDLRFFITAYANGNLAIQAKYYDAEFDGFLPYANVTVNLGKNKLPYNRAYYDENNLGHTLREALREAGAIADFVQVGQSGFCSYPMFEFTDSFLNGELPFSYK